MTAPSRRAQNRQDRTRNILDAALSVFADVGYAAASMDLIAAQAGLSKPTLYHYFAGKEALFKAVMAARRDEMLLSFDSDPRDALVAQLLDFAWGYARVVMRPDVLSLARLIIAEAQRFPSIGRAYQANGPDIVLRRLMAFMQHQRELGRLQFEDAELVAQDFWGLILSAPRNHALHVPDADITEAQLARYIHNGLRTFLRAYATNPAQNLAQLSKQIAPV
ncbi:MAG: TetR/AcrR family transcriptional regulator [Paracoccaceae bacterium]